MPATNPNAAILNVPTKLEQRFKPKLHCGVAGSLETDKEMPGAMAGHFYILLS